MARYIDADALIKEAEKECNQDGSYGYMDTKSIVDLINATPTADVVEVKHGKWIYSNAGNWKCSLCGDEPYYDSKKGLNYCPNCGAKMDAERREA